MKISNKGRYAIRLLIDISLNQKDSDEFISINDISKRQDISLKYLEKIVNILLKGDILISQRGKSGGYRLAKKASEITVGSVLKLTECDMRPSDCISDDCNCEMAKSCMAKNCWNKLYLVIMDYLDSISIDDMCCEKCL